MTKIELNPSFLQDFVDIDKPAIIHISNKNVTFTPKAIKVLALKLTDKFILTIEGTELYLKLITSENGFEVKNKNKYCMNSYVAGLLMFIVKHFKYEKTVKSISFTLGEFKEGRYPLLPGDVKDGK